MSFAVTAIISVMIDSSNHKDIKIVQLLMIYFGPKKGVQIKLLKLKAILGKTY